MNQSSFNIEQQNEAPTYETKINMKMNLNKMIKYYLRAPNRKLVYEIFKYNKPNDYTLLKLIYEANPSNKIMYIATSVYRKYPINYFYELVAYSYEPPNKKERFKWVK